MVSSTKQRSRSVEVRDRQSLAQRLIPPTWGMGLATEAALASVCYGFDNLGLKQIIGLTMPENIASLRVLEKAGLRRIGAVTFESEPAGQPFLPPEHA